MNKVPLNATSAWWSKKRTTYNLGLMAAGILAFIAYAVVGSFLLPPEAEFEITVFTIFALGAPCAKDGQTPYAKL